RCRSFPSAQAAEPTADNDDGSFLRHATGLRGTRLARTQANLPQSRPNKGASRYQVALSAALRVSTRLASVGRSRRHLAGMATAAAAIALLVPGSALAAPTK